MRLFMLPLVITFCLAMPALAMDAPLSEGPLAKGLLPDVYVLAVGVSDYRDPKLRLGFADKDATDIAEMFRAQSGGLYSKVETRVLTDQTATREAVLDGFNWLEHAVTKPASRHIRTKNKRECMVSPMKKPAGLGGQRGGCSRYG